MLARRWQVLVACALWGLVIFAVASYTSAGVIAGQEPHYAGLVIAFPEGRLESSCVQFDDDRISGAELLRSSGLSVVLSGFGGLGEGVCQIDGQGCDDPGNCWCQCRGADCASWVYYSLQDGEWRFENSGASQRQLESGDVDGWVWGDGRSPPPEVSFDEICPLASAPGDDAPPVPRPTARPTSVPVAGVDEPPDVPANDAGPPPVDAGVAAPTGELDASDATAAVTPPDDDRQVVRQDEQPAPAEDAQAALDDNGGGAPVGLIAFGAVAAALVVGIGGLTLRRRLRG